MRFTSTIGRDRRFLILAIVLSGTDAAYWTFGLRSKSKIELPSVMLLIINKEECGENSSRR